MPKWPYKYEWITELGYVVWRDVFEGVMRCTLRDAVLAHKVAVFVEESEAEDYCEYRNAKTIATRDGVCTPLQRFDENICDNYVA